MRIVFLGTAQFAVPLLEALVRVGHHLAGVVTGEDKPAGRGRRMRPTPVKELAASLNLPILTPGKLKDPSFLPAFRQWEPDLAIVAAFRILPEEVFDLPPLGTLNVHPSLLPRYRGPAPIQWALIRGEKETGVSIIRITRRVDAGGLLAQETVPIDPLETAGELSRRLALIGGEMVLKLLNKFPDHIPPPLPQDEKAVTRAPKLTKEDGLIDWTDTALDVHNLVRGVTPWPGAFTRRQGKTLKLYNSRPVEGQGKPGEILQAGDELIVACVEGAVEFGEIQREGRQRMTIQAFLRGADLKPGELLGR